MAVQRATAVLGSAVFCLLALLEGSSDFISLLRNIEPHVSQNVLDMPAFVVLLPLLECPHHSPEAGHPYSFKEKPATSPIYIYIAGILWQVAGSMWGCLKMRLSFVHSSSDLFGTQKTILILLHIHVGSGW